MMVIYRLGRVAIDDGRFMVRTFILIS